MTDRAAFAIAAAFIRLAGMALHLWRNRHGVSGAEWRQEIEELAARLDRRSS